ncbi:MAG: hypothetical protein M1840_006320 [Geoglossum simile]|nr:MAG: hypothetical protein M1840_006320 [Geoglossum simile]
MAVYVQERNNIRNDRGISKRGSAKNILKQRALHHANITPATMSSSFQSRRSKRRVPPKSRGRRVNGEGMLPLALQHKELSASSFPQISNPRTITTGTHLERSYLTECNLEELNNPQSDSSERTLCDPETDNHAEDMIKDRDPVQFKRTPTPSPPPNVAIVRGPEKPCSAVIQTPEPHLCALGLRCTRWIESLNYHRTRVIYLNAAAVKLRLPVNPYAGESNSLTYLRNEAESIASFLKNYRFDLGEVLKKIQSPEYWDTEKAYLKSSGCLEQRQKEEHAGSRKRNWTAVGNDTTPKRRCLGQAQLSPDSASSLKLDKTPITQSANLATPQQLPAIASESAASGPETKSYGYESQVEKTKSKGPRNHSTPEIPSKRCDYKMNKYITRSVLRKKASPRQNRSAGKTAIEHGIVRRSERISKLNANASTSSLGHTSLYPVRSSKVPRARRKVLSCV